MGGHQNIQKTFFRSEGDHMSNSDDVVYHRSMSDLDGPDLPLASTEAHPFRHCMKSSEVQEAEGNGSFSPCFPYCLTQSNFE